MTNSPMMQPSQWNNGVQQPNYATPLLDFSPMGDIAGNIAGQLKSAQAKPSGQPLQLTHGPNQAKPVQPQGMAGGMNAMASTANAAPWASALMKMFGGTGLQQPAGFSAGSPGGMNFLGGSQNAIY